MLDTKLDEIEEAILGGMQVAREKYEYWTTLDFWYAPEYLMTSYCANEIAKRFDDWYVVPEASAAEIRQEVSPNQKRGRPFNDEKSRQGRYDLAIYDDAELPRALVELKTGYGARSNGPLKKDLLAMQRQMSRSGSHLIGCFFGYYYMCGETRDPIRSVETTFNSREACAHECCLEGFTISQRRHGPALISDEDREGRAAWGMAVIRIERLDAAAAA